MDVLGFLNDFHIDYELSGKNVGKGWVGVDCPFCGDSGKHGGFSMDYGGWHCWKCVTKHSTRSAIKALTRSSWGTVNAIMEKYFKGFGIHRSDYKEAENSKPFVYPGDNPIPEQVDTYLLSRGFNPDFIKSKYHIGWGGLEGAYSLRMIIPIYFNHQLVSYQGRDITEMQPIRYKDCTISSAIIYHKKLLYNLDNCQENWCVVVEGVTDVWAIGDNSCATFGTGFTEEQAIMLSDFFDKVVVWYDPGYESQSVAHRLAHKLGLLGVKTKVFSINGLADAAELPKRDVENFKSIMELWGRGE